MSSVGFSILALNEELELEVVYQAHKDALVKQGLDHEIFIIDDASTDQTGPIADRIAERDPSVTVIHHKKTMGFGYGYKEGMRLTTKEYYMYAVGANLVEKEDIHLALDYVNKKDFIIFYIQNQKIKPYKRQKITNIFTFLLNFLTGLDLHYYNALYLCRTRCLRALDMRLNSHGFQAEAVVQLIKHFQCSYEELGYKLKYRRSKSSGLRWDKIVDGGTILWHLFLEKYFRLGGRFSYKEKTDAEK